LVHSQNFLLIVGGEYKDKFCPDVLRVNIGEGLSSTTLMTEFSLQREDSPAPIIAAIARGTWVYVYGGNSKKQLDCYQHTQVGVEPKYAWRYDPTFKPPKHKNGYLSVEYKDYWILISALGQPEVDVATFQLPTTVLDATSFPLSIPNKKFLKNSMIETLPDEPPLPKGPLEIEEDFHPNYSCEYYVKQLKGSKMKKLDDVLSSYKRWFESFVVSAKCTNPYELSTEEMFSVGLYAWDLGIASVRQDNFYYNLNVMLRERKPETLDTLKGYLYFLQKALSKLPNLDKIVYRGVPDTNIVQKHYTHGTKVYWTSYSSTTTNLDQAQSFAGPTGVVFKIKVFTGKDIKDYSPFPDEDEVLLSPNMDLLVTSNLYDKDGTQYVELTQAKPGPKFVF